MKFREALWASVGDRQKPIAMKAFPNQPDAQKAASALAKIIGPTPDRADTVFDVIEAVFDLGDPEILLAYLEQRLKRDPTRMIAEIDRRMGHQFDMFDEQVQTIADLQKLKKQLVEIVHLAEVIPFRRKDGG